MVETSVSLQPGEFSRYMLRALEASEGRTKRRKRDQRPDEIGLGIKREILRRAAEEEPPAEEFEAWLMAQVAAAPAPGGVRAMCAQILEEYRVANLDRSFGDWLRSGAPSDDASSNRAHPSGPAEPALEPSPAGQEQG